MSKIQKTSFAVIDWIESYVCTDARTLTCISGGSLKKPEEMVPGDVVLLNAKGTSWRRKINSVWSK